jgi:hypothetical protein
MKDLPPEAAALLARARADHEPTSRELASSLDKLHHTLEFTPELAPSSTVSAQFDDGSNVVRGGLLTARSKAVLLTVVIAGIVTVGVHGRRPHTAPAPRASFSVSSVPGVTAPQQESRPAEQGREAMVPSGGAVRSVTTSDATKTSDLSRSKEVRPRRAPTGGAPRTARPPVRAEASPGPRAETNASSKPPSQREDGALAARIAVDSSLWEEEDPPPPSELELIDGALSSLRDHDPRHALAMLAQHAELYPHGMLATERRGLRVLALCAAGERAQAGRERSAYLSVAAHTPMAERVRRACRPEGEP